jgi:hypothetical protein
MCRHQLVPWYVHARGLDCRIMFRAFSTCPKGNWNSKKDGTGCASNVHGNKGISFEGVRPRLC